MKPVNRVEKPQALFDLAVFRIDRRLVYPNILAKPLREPGRDRLGEAAVPDIIKIRRPGYQAYERLLQIFASIIFRRELFRLPEIICLPSVQIIEGWNQHQKA